MNNYNSYPRPVSASSLSPSGFASANYGNVPLYDPTSGVTPPQINQTPGLQHEARPSVSEQQPIGSTPFHQSQNTLFGGNYHSCPSTKGSSGASAGFPAVTFSQAAYNQLNQQQQPPQPQLPQAKCSNNIPHQCVADQPSPIYQQAAPVNQQPPPANQQAPPVSQQPPLASNMAHQTQIQWPQPSSYGATPTPRSPYSQTVNMNGKFAIEAGLRSERVLKALIVSSTITR